ncbi:MULTISPECIES: DUF2934 domain-containing protein [Rhizobium]|uniref:DUF2934 domain-containing protein n=1 Tax=Rhizobium tropici TaxID=398 RepID=A0A6P1CCD1_RHITR|nr:MULTISPECIES: DUF2934 domain-containing protein [Rhizobium]AGB71782.1 hypothetical protein RTCIAT899_CH12005 [Rhizobium tropici CIAT 899]MBB4245088.1 hypothetical protein [Rhizobium tropici]MBB5596451.1 hypothetical protein [Rhizobium tropici]MBB6495458.1 hypothetical protein [Rhizobium tropici]NEV14497.1 DUF2934 domain-containing protein [Rhizobium tropici]
MAKNGRPTREEEIRSRAYQIWENEGRPEGEHLTHWHRAEHDVSRRRNRPKQGEPGRSPVIETEGVTQATHVPEAPPALAAPRKRVDRPPASRSGEYMAEQENKSPDT